MIIEVLFAEICNLYGDPQNAEYLRQTLPQAEMIHTSLDAEPYFAQKRPDIIVMGSMSDSMHSFVIQKLGRYRSRIDELIRDNVVFLITGSAVDVFCKTIENVTLERKIDGLGIIPFDVKINWFDRYNGKVLANLGDMTITGFRSQFSTFYGEHNNNFFVKAERGMGINKNSNLEGFRINNFFAIII